MVQGRKAGMLPYGNGCKLYPDCFTCLAPNDCVWEYGINKDRQKLLSDIWKPYFERELSKVTVGGKG